MARPGSGRQNDQEAISIADGIRGRLLKRRTQQENKRYHSSKVTKSPQRAINGGSAQFLPSALRLPLCVACFGHFQTAVSPRATSPYRPAKRPPASSVPSARTAFASFRGAPRLRIDLDGCGQARDQANAIRYLINPDVHRYTLS